MKRAHNFVDLTGKVFNHLTAVEFIGIDKHKHSVWKFKCDCGKEKIISKINVLTGTIWNCGCLRKKQLLYGTKFYATFYLIKQRCDNPKCPRYSSWGGRGIKCLWTSFEEFRNDMYESFLEHEKLHGGRQTTIDRIDNNSHYCKENCRWATPSEQMRNTRRNRKK